MKQAILLMFVALVGFSSQSFAQTAKFKFLNGETHDFGKIKKGPVASHSFEFENVGDAPLLIVDVKPSCSCTNVDWDKQPIAPGKKGKITLGVKTSELSGVFNKGVYIQSNAKTPNGEKRYTIYLKGETVE